MPSEKSMEQAREALEGKWELTYSVARDMSDGDKVSLYECIATALDEERQKAIEDGMQRLEECQRFASSMSDPTPEQRAKQRGITECIVALRRLRDGNPS